MRDIRLLASELITNAVRHAGLGPAQRISFRVYVPPGLVRVEVRHGGAGFEPFVPTLPEPKQTGGRGLHLVHTLSDRWGVERDPVFCVWFEMERVG